MIEMDYQPCIGYVSCIHRNEDEETDMKLALIGATGFVGSAVLTEALSRGHMVTAMVKNVAKVPAAPGLTARASNAMDAADVAAGVVGHDAVISAFNPGWGDPALYDNFIAGSKAITAGVKQADVKRLLVVGGAGSLFVAPGVQLVDTPEFPEAWKQGALAARDALKLLQTETALEWSFLSPPAHLHPGERSGQFRLGKDDLMMDGAAPAGITVSDLAMAIIDEIENPQHLQSRFAVAH